MTENNPLINYFREKEVYVPLPTQGKYYDPQIENLSVDGEIGVRPMTAKDEIMMKTPDTLFNGTALVNLVESVAPDVKDAYNLKIPDVDAILTASRVATYGKNITVNAACPKCEADGLYDVDLTSILAKIHKIIDDDEIEVQGLTVKLQPNSLSCVTAKTINYSKSFALQIDINRDTDNLKENEEKFKQATELIAATEIAIMADGIRCVVLPDGTEVNDKQQIVDWLTNTNSNTFKIIQEKIVKLNESGVPMMYNFKCGEEKCGDEFTTTVDLNPSFFFTRSINEH